MFYSILKKFIRSYSKTEKANRAKKYKLSSSWPQKPSKVTWMSADLVHAMSYQFMVLLLTCLNNMIEISGSSKHCSYSQNMSTGNKNTANYKANFCWSTLSFYLMTNNKIFDQELSHCSNLGYYIRLALVYKETIPAEFLSVKTCYKEIFAYMS